MKPHECYDPYDDYEAPMPTTDDIIRDPTCPFFIKQFYGRYKTISDIDCDRMRLKIPVEHYMRRDCA